MESEEPLSDVRSHKEISAGFMASHKYKEMGLSQVEFEESVDVGYLVLHEGRKIPIVSNAASPLWLRDHRKMPVVRGKIGTKSVDVLRDTGCSGVIVKQQHVTDDQHTGRVGMMQMVDNSVIRVPIANVEIDSPYLSGQVQALCPQDAVYDVIVGNVPGARPAATPNLQWVETQAAVTRAARRREGKGEPALCQSPEKQWISVNRKEIIKMQAEDDSLQRPMDMIGEVKVRNRREVTFEKKNGILYRIFKHSSVNRGEPIRQVIIPKPLRGQVMHLVHNSIMGRHMGIRKTTNRVLTNFY